MRPLRSAPINPLAPHVCHFTFDQGESPAYVRDQLGHSSIKMTVDIYGHWIPGANRQAVNRLLGLASPATVSPLERRPTEIPLGFVFQRRSVANLVVANKDLFDRH